ncbi:class I SAM-dependent methyltransferase [Clostridium sp. CTA-5]
MDTYYYERLFNIKTCGEQKIFNESLHYNRYEPTSYFVLETLFEKYKLKDIDSLIDFGCGKGRLNFYINYFFDSNVTGIEMNNYYYKEGINNKINYLKNNKKDKNKIKFFNCFAEEYKIQPYDNKFYFFNPFSLQIFMKVISNILLSVEEVEREVDVILYYPSDDYIYYLETRTCFKLIDEIKLNHLYDKDNRQKICIYRLTYL